MNVLTALKTQKLTLVGLLFSIVLFLAALIYFLLPEGKDLAFETVHDNVLPETTKQGIYVIKSEDEWKNMWSQVSSKTPKDPSGVDFSKSTVLAVFAGTKNTSGYSMLVKRVADLDKKVKIFTEEESPGKSCFYAQALSNPYHIIRINKTNKLVTLKNAQRKKDCEEARR